MATSPQVYDISLEGCHCDNFDADYAEIRREVHVDSTTAVPHELYLSMMKAAAGAKARGQHQLVSSPKSCKSDGSSPEKRLVRFGMGS